MDVLSGGASVMAAVSLTLQLIDTVNTLREFWLGMKGAPAHIQEIVNDLTLLNDILFGIDRAYALHDDPNDHDEAHAKAVYRALLQCQKHVDRMREFADILHVGMVNRRHWTAFKAVLHKPRLAEFSKNIEQAKSTLLMAINVTTLLLQNECGKAVQAQFASLRSDMMVFAIDVAESVSKSSSDNETSVIDSPPPPYQEDNTRKDSSKVLHSKSRGITASDVLLWLIKLPPNSPYRQSLYQYGRLVGRIAWQSSTRLVNSSNCAQQTPKDSMMVSLELPIIRRSFTIHSEKYFGQWTHSFRVTRIVPDDAAIFKLCATQDLDTIRQLFQSGLASPFDQTASGINLLHAAAAGYRCQTYKFLSDAGVEYGLCEDSLYGKLTPIELTQRFTLFIEGRIQTVQEWLNIHEDQKSILHPEKNYDCITRIWNKSIEMQEDISDSEIITMLQGPLSSPRETENLLNLAKQASATNQTIARYSSAHLLFCYYFLFHQDPYGRRITRAIIHIPSLNREMPLYDYVGKYWNREEWFQLLSKCTDLDFHGLARRQQDNYVLNSPKSIWEIGPGNRKMARISSGVNGYSHVWIGLVKEWEGIFEFEGDREPVGVTAEKRADSRSAPLESSPLHHKDSMTRLANSLVELTWFRWLILSIGFHYLLYYYVFR